MSTIVFLGPPAHGHVNPTLPVARELIQRGEQVVYFNHEEFCSRIEATGATFHPYPEGAIRASDFANRLQQGGLATVGLLILRATEHLLPYLLEQLPLHRPDLVIYDSIALWGKMAATRLGVRSVSSITHFLYDTSYLMGEGDTSFTYLLQFLPQLPQLMWARLRLGWRYRDCFPKARPLLPLRGDMNLVFTARDLQPESALIDDTFRFVGPSVSASTQQSDFPFERLTEQPLVYISLGTVHTQQYSFYQHCFAAFRGYPAQFILSVGRDTNIEQLGAIPDNFMVRQSVPQLAVLERCALFFTHGGMNSIHEGLYYGVPLILIPYQLEQLLNARLVERQGAGVVSLGGVGGNPVSVAELQNLLEKVLHQPSYQEAAGRIKMILRATGGFMQAADEIQQLLDSHLK